MVFIEYKRFEGESDEELIYRITGEKEKIGSWQDVADILNRLLGTEYTESKFRKQRQAFDRMFASVKAAESDYATEIQNKLRELAREKIKYQDERRAWNAQNYAAARIDETMERIEAGLRDAGRINFPEVKVTQNDGSKEIVCLLADLHIGQCFSSVFGGYDVDIAAIRLLEYSSRVKEIGKRHGARVVRVVSVGDQISGNIHSAIVAANQENVIEQVKIASRLIAWFCNELYKTFEEVYFYDVFGNHSRITPNKKDAIKDERLDDLVGWSACQMLAHLPNFHDERKAARLDSTLGKFQIGRKTYCFIHGDMDTISRDGINRLSAACKTKPDYILLGHNHTPEMREIDGVQVFQSGSLPGSGDDFTMAHRLISKPSQTVLVCDDEGVECCYNIALGGDDHE